MVAHTEMKLGMYAYYIISMTITCFHDDRILFEETSDDYLYNYFLTPQTRTHGGETWCACVLHRFHDDHNNK